LKTRTDYDRAFEVVKSVIDAWDPYSLLAGGAPPDEFELEVGKLLPRIEHIHTPEDAVREVVSVFGQCFDRKEFTPESCADVGARLYSKLEAAGLLATRET
jgi:hypothetical protein